MDQSALVSERIAAGARFLAGLQKTLPVQVAFWLKSSEETEGHLYVASDQVTDKNIDTAYGEVLRVLLAMPNPWLDPFQVKLIGAEDPLAQAARNVLRRYPGRGPAGVHGQIFGGMSVDEVYIYPSVVPAPAS